MLSGSSLLAMIERLLEDSRRELEHFDTQLARATAELARMRQAELGVLGILARLRLREIEQGEVIEELEETARQVTEILDKRGGVQAAVGAQITAVEEDLAKIEADRAEQVRVVDAAERAVEAAAAETKRRLEGVPEYRALVESAEEAQRVAELAQSKALESHTDRAAKGKPYEADVLFAYLWERGYGTVRYRASPVARLVDRWIAGVAAFEPLRRNYVLLNELPARFDEHALRMRNAAEERAQAVRSYAEKAAGEAGVTALQRELAAAEEALASIDRTIEQREADLAALVEKRARFASGEDELSMRCTDLLRQALGSQQMRTLRARANRTSTPDDDAAVDELTVARAEMPRLEDEAARYRALHGAQRARAGKLEELRKRFKEHRYDAASSGFVNGELIATLLDQLLAGGLTVADIWDALSKQRRRQDIAADAEPRNSRSPNGQKPRAASRR